MNSSVSSSIPEVAGLAADLERAQGREEVALVALTRMLSEVDDAMSGTGAPECKRWGTPLRAVMHLRPSDAYRTLMVLEHGGSSLHDPDPEGVQFLSSSTVWRAIVEHRVAIAVDLLCGAVWRVADRTPLQGETAALAAAESRQRFLGREATHVLAVPLRAAGGRVVGMVNLEVAGSTALKVPPLFAGVAVLEQIAELAAPYLLAAPNPPPVLEPPDPYLPVAGQSVSAMLPILRAFARQEETVLISGPTGVGKSRLARWCHEQSDRRGHPFEVLDLTTVPDELQLAELFGWTRGAFTGAVRETPGAVARAEGGTLFLDEIDKLSLKAQSGMLQLLERRTYRPLGDGQEHRGDVRFIIGTNADLGALVRSGAFREDLYFRINVLPVRLPPVDERRDEIGPWAEYMLQRHHGDRAGSARFEPDALERLRAATWPGNLRQLDNVVRRAYTLATVANPNAVAREEVRVRAQDVAAALGYEPQRSSGPGDLLWQAARAIVTEAKRRGGFDLDLAEAFRGYVLAAAVDALGPEEALRLLGKETQVTNRNHHRLLKREGERVQKLLEALGLSPGAVVAVLSQSERE